MGQNRHRTITEEINMKLKQLFSFSSRSSSTGSLELGKRDFHSQYMVKEQLGKGGFGVVYAAVRRSDGIEVAVKEVSKDERVVVGPNSIPLEVALMQQVQDVPGVIKFIDYFDMQHCFYIVMERFNSKDLFDFISEAGPLPEGLAKDIFRQLLVTLVTCHHKGIVHRDIKGENILIDVNTLKIKLIDFGSGTFLRIVCTMSSRELGSILPQSGSTTASTGLRASPSGPWASSSTTWSAGTSPSSVTPRSPAPTSPGSPS